MYCIFVYLADGQVSPLSVWALSTSPSPSNTHIFFSCHPSNQIYISFWPNQTNQTDFYLGQARWQGFVILKKERKGNHKKLRIEKKVIMSEVYIQYHEINWKSLRWSDRFPQTENNFTILLSPNTKHFEAWAQKCLEDGMCTKDEEREPLQPDGNNKDVKVITTKMIFVKVKVKLYHWKVKVKWYFKKMVIRW